MLLFLEAETLTSDCLLRVTTDWRSFSKWSDSFNLSDLLDFSFNYFTSSYDEAVCSFVNSPWSVVLTCIKAVFGVSTCFSCLLISLLIVSKYIQLSMSVEAVCRVVTPILKWYSDVIFSNLRQNQIREVASILKLLFTGIQKIFYHIAVLHSFSCFWIHFPIS